MNSATVKKTHTSGGIPDIQTIDEAEQNILDGLCFSRKMHGYDPREVDIKLDSLLEIVNKLKAENNNLKISSESFKLSNKELAEKLKRLEAERIDENRRLRDVLQKADLIAEQTLAEAQSAAIKISEDAQQKWVATRDSALEAVKVACYQREQVVKDAKMRAAQIIMDANKKLEDISKKAMLLAELSEHAKLDESFDFEDENTQMQLDAPSEQTEFEDY